MTDFAELQAELESATKDVYTHGFLFALEHGASGTQASLVNGRVGDILALADGTDELILEYGLATRTGGDTSKVHKTELARSQDGLELRRTELATGRIIGQIELPPQHRHAAHDDHEFDTINDCLAAFDKSDFKVELLELANKTCSDQFAHLHCCLTNGDCYSVVIIVRPTSWKCLVSVAYDPAQYLAPLNG